MSEDAGDIARQLAAKIGQLAPQLLRGSPWRDGDIWRWGSIAGEEGQSLAVWVGGPKRGRWREFNGYMPGDRQTGGDALDLVAATRFAGDLGEALKWARDWLGLGQLSAEEQRQQSERARRAAAARDLEDRRRSERRASDAKGLWLAGKPLQAGDPVCRYLEGRGVELGRLPRLPGALRCHPGLYHRPTNTTWPAMVAAITGLDRDGGAVHVATQRTWLNVSNGEVIKAPLGHDGKMTLGKFRHCGGAIHLTRGASGKPWAAALEGETIAIAEGIEDALTFAGLRPDLRVAACATGLAYLAHVALPPGCREVVVIRQNDPRGSDAWRATERGIEGLRARGFVVAEFRPPLFVKDLNDYAQWQARPVPVEAE